MYADRMNPLRRHQPREVARRLNGLLASIALAVLAVVGLVACGEQAPVPSPTPSTAAPATSTPAVTTPPATPSATPSASATVTVLVYFLRDQRIAAARRDVPATKAVATAAVRALLRGPHAEERAAGLQSALSPGMELVRITIRTRTAFVELTATPDDVPLEAPRLQLAQIVHTATLIHDDVADGSAERRGQPTVSALLGAGTAVLLGDYWLARAVDLVVDTAHRDAVIRKFAKTLTDLAEGEMLQLEKASSLDIPQKIS